MQKTINFLKSWTGRILSHPTTKLAVHVFVATFLGVLLVGIASTKNIGDVWTLVAAAISAGFSAAFTATKNAIKGDQVTIPDEEN